MSEPTTYTGRRGRKKSPDSGQPTSVGLVADAFLPSPPAELSPEATVEYERVGEFLLATRRVSKLDLQSLAVYAASYAYFSDAIRPLIIGRNRIWDFVNDKAKPSKMANVSLQHGKIVLEQARRFGMTARTRHLDHAISNRAATPQQIKDLQTGKAIRNEDAELYETNAPEWFDPRAKSEWSRLTGALAANDLWTPLDFGPVAVCCASFSLLMRCASDLGDELLSVRVGDSNQFVEHPLSVIYRDHFWLCQSIWTDYGMTPLDRTQFLHAEADRQGKPKLNVYPITG